MAKHIQQNCRRGNHDPDHRQLTNEACVCTCHVHEDYTILTERGMWHIAMGHYTSVLENVIEAFADVAVQEEYTPTSEKCEETVAEIETCADVIEQTIATARQRLGDIEEALRRLELAQTSAYVARENVQAAREG